MFAGRRVTCPANEALAAFILSKREELLQKPKVSENLDNTFTTAFKNVCDHASPILSLRDAGQVRGIGNWMLKQIKDYFGEAVEPFPSSQDGSPTKGKKRRYLPQKNSAPYALLITLHRSTSGDKTFMMKQELIDAAELSGLSRMPIQPSKGSSASGRFGDSTKDWYSGWSSMKTLVSKGLVVKSSCPAKYMLTEEGRNTAEECMKRAGLMHDSNANHVAGPATTTTANGVSERGSKRAKKSTSSSAAIPASSAPSTSTSGAGGRVWKSSPPVQDTSTNTANCPAALPPEPIPSTTSSGTGAVRVWKPSSQASQGSDSAGKFSNSLALPPLGLKERFSDVYKVVLILDDREQFTRSKGVNSKPMFAQRLCEQYQVEVQIRHLPVGDAVWIACHKVTHLEYVLDFIVERKGVDDLWTSIKDTRYKNQKLRLLRCGINRLIYLIEGDLNLAEAAESLKTAALTTEVLEGFDVQRTRDVHETISKYGELTNAISRRYATELGQSITQVPVAMSYEEFVTRCNDLEKERITDVFGVQLMQVKHVTEDVALSILQKYPTLLSLVQAYILLEGDTQGQENLLSGLPICNRSKSISSAVSKNVYKFVWAS